jgi:hypothetical protein
MRLRCQIDGDFGTFLMDFERELARDFRDAMDQAGISLQNELKQQTLSALSRGQGVANAWKRQTYPKNPLSPTLRPTAFVWTRAPNIIQPIDTGEVITVQRGKWLVWPTGYNALAGRRNASGRGGMRVKPEEMVAARKQTAVIPTSNPKIKLWCLRVRQASSLGGKSRRGRGRIQLFVGNRNVQVNTGRGKASQRQARQQQLVESGLVPMFFMSKQVHPGKRLDIDAAADRAGDRIVSMAATAKGGV